MFLNGDAIPEPNDRGERVVDDSFLLCFNAHDEAQDFVTPKGNYAKQWTADWTPPTPPAQPIWWSPRARRSRCSRGRCLVLRKTA